MDNAIQQILQQNNIASSPSSAGGDPINSILQQNGIAGAAADSQEQDLGRQDYNGECQKYVEQKTLGHAGVYGTAADAFADQASKGNVSADYSKMKPGDAIYFAPDNSNDNAGHVGIYDGDGEFTSATYNGIQKSKLDQWMSTTGQKPVGFVRGYK